MRLRTKLPLYTSLIVLFSIITVSLLAIIQFKIEIDRNIQQYKKEATNQILNHLKDIVNIAYSMIDNAYRASSPRVLKEKYGFDLKDTSMQTVKMIAVNIMKITLENLRVLRFGDNGYIWINEFNPPYTVIMHPIKPELEGKAWVFYIENTDKNVYEAFHDSIVVGHGAGRVSYNFYKPGTNKRIPKISWVRLYEPLNWVIGTGVYVDYIDKMVAKKRAALQRQVKSMILTVSIIGLLFIFLSIFALYTFGRTITDPLEKIRQALSEMAKGKPIESFEMNRNDEIGDMKKSLDQLIEGFHKYSYFALEIGRGNFDVKFEKLSDEDLLGNSLLQMRQSLIEARNKEIERRRQEEIRRWINEGINRFSDIIAVSDNIDIMAERVITRLVDYVGASQGGIFILNIENEKTRYLELKAMVAFNRRKYLKKRIELNEGLIGACFMEKQPIYLTDLPDDYLEIRTGIGAAMPKNVYITPIKYEDKVYGVIEVASFSLFESHHKQFLDSVAQLMAISLSTKPQYINM